MTRALVREIPPSLRELWLSDASALQPYQPQTWWRRAVERVVAAIWRDA